MIDLIDIQAGFGGSAPGVRHPYQAAGVVAQLQRHRISKAVVRITPETQDFDVVRSNERLYSATQRFSELLPCPVVVPAICGDVAPEADQVAAALAHAAVGVVFRPGPDCWLPEPWVLEPLLAALSEHRLPVLCLERLMPYAAIEQAARAAPDVPFIVTEVGYRNHRSLMALMQRHANVYLSIGNAFTAHQGVEWYSRQIGHERLLFGTGLPDSDPGAAIGQLLYADLPAPTLEQIGTGNFVRLQEAIRR